MNGFPVKPKAARILLAIIVLKNLYISSLDCPRYCLFFYQRGSPASSDWEFPLPVQSWVWPSHPWLSFCSRAPPFQLESGWIAVPDHQKARGGAAPEYVGLPILPALISPLISLKTSFDSWFLTPGSEQSSHTAFDMPHPVLPKLLLCGRSKSVVL